VGGIGLPTVMLRPYIDISNRYSGVSRQKEDRFRAGHPRASLWRSVERGGTRGGIILFWSSILELFHKQGIVIGVDIEIKTHTQEAIKESLFKHR
jgi:hypothetical protein